MRFGCTCFIKPDEGRGPPPPPLLLDVMASSGGTSRDSDASASSPPNRLRRSRWEERETRRACDRSERESEADQQLEELKLKCQKLDAANRKQQEMQAAYEAEAQAALDAMDD